MEGDLASAIDVLDLLASRGIAIDIVHLTSTIRACWGVEGERHESAKEILQMAFDLDLQPNVVTFTAFVGSFVDAPLDQLLAAYAQMKDLHIKPNRVFAETFVTTIFGRIPHGSSTQSILTDFLPSQPPPRVAAAQAALRDFKAAGVKLTSLLEAVDAAMQKWRGKRVGK